MVDRTLKETTHSQRIYPSSITCNSRTPQKPLSLGKHINNILQDIRFKSTTRERCIYQTKVRHHQALFLRQVDDFAVAGKDPAIAKDMIAQIRAKLQVPPNHLGVIAKFNGIHVLQT